MKKIDSYKVQNRGNESFRILEDEHVWEVLPHNEICMHTEPTRLAGENYTHLHIETVEVEVEEKPQINILMAETKPKEVNKRGKMRKRTSVKAKRKRKN